MPPEALLMDIEIPDRSNAKTAGDLVRIIVADEQAMLLKNADLAALRNYRNGLATLD